MKNYNIVFNGFEKTPRFDHEIKYYYSKILSFKIKNKYIGSHRPQILETYSFEVMRYVGLQVKTR